LRGGERDRFDFPESTGFFLGGEENPILLKRQKEGEGGSERKARKIWWGSVGGRGMSYSKGQEKRLKRRSTV